MAGEPEASADAAASPRRPHRRRIWLTVGVVTVVVVVVVVLAVFQPQKLFIDTEVHEALPSDPVAVARGSFTSIAHPTSGTAVLVRLPDGSHLVRLENLETDNGPDVRVAVSSASAGSGDYSNLERLAPLKGNVGDQNYTLPADVDVRELRSVVLWCERFSVAFGDAPLVVG